MPTPIDWRSISQGTSFVAPPESERLVQPPAMCTYEYRWRFRRNAVSEGHSPVAFSLPNSRVPEAAIIPPYGDHWRRVKRIVWRCAPFGGPSIHEHLWTTNPTKNSRNRSNLPGDSSLWESPPTLLLVHSASEQNWTSGPKVSRVIPIAIWEQINLIRL